MQTPSAPSCSVCYHDISVRLCLVPHNRYHAHVVPPSSTCLNRRILRLHVEVHALGNGDDFTISGNEACRHVAKPQLDNGDKFDRRSNVVYGSLSRPKLPQIWWLLFNMRDRTGPLRQEWCLFHVKRLTCLDVTELHDGWTGRALHYKFVCFCLTFRLCHTLENPGCPQVQNTRPSGFPTVFPPNLTIFPMIPASVLP